MSNALPILLAVTDASTQPASQPAEVSSTMMNTLCGIGICVFLIWLARTAIEPTKVKLSRTPGRRNHLTPVHIVMLFLVWQLLVPLLVIKASGVNVKFVPDHVRITSGMISQAALVCCGLVMAAYCFGGGAVKGMGFTPRRWINDSIRSVIGFLAILPVCMILLTVTTWLVRYFFPDPPIHPYLKMLKSPETSTFWATTIILSAVVLAPLAEEIFFRGLLQSMFRRYLRKPWIAIIITSILFSAIHFDADPKSLPALFALSLALGYNYERTGRLYSPIMIHMLFNAVMITNMLISN
ncbi:MAG: CPBP family intramembrane metalloprotease [bacterium]|nr:CPBP family intramembrane metalloprotease [bacterium]